MEQETFTLLPLSIDPQSKALSSPSSSSDASPSFSTTLAPSLDALNKLHKHIIALEAPLVAPPPPAPIKPNRSQQIHKLKDTGNAALKKQDSATAIRHYDLALDMAQQRPPWEPAQLVREECAMLYGNRAQAHLAARSWPDALVDAELSLECKRGGNAKAHWRGAKALSEMGRKDEALERVRVAVDVEEGATVQAKAQLEQLRAQIRAAEEQIRAQGGQGQVPPQARQQEKAIEEAVKVQEEGVRELRELRSEMEAAAARGAR